MTMPARTTAEKGGRVAMLAGGNAPPVLEASEHDLDAVPSAIAPLVVSDRLIARSTTRDAGLSTLDLESIPQPDGVIASIGE
jgi:hypothetical protein